MPANRIRTALEALGGTGTTWDISQVSGTSPGSVSGQISGMERRGDVCRAGTVVQMRDRGCYGRKPVRVTVWRLA